MAKDNKAVPAESFEEEVFEKETSENDISDVKAEIEKLLASAKAEAAKIIEEAKEAASRLGGEAEVSELESEVARKSREDGEELCEVMLFKDGGKYSSDVYVSVNGENCVVKRGIKVKIKRKFYEVLMASQEQDMLASEMQDALSEQYKQKAKFFE